MLPTTFQEMGIPVGYGFKQLLFSPLANCVVLQACSVSDNWRPERIFFRRSDWDKYRILGNPADLVSQESPFIHPSKPLLAYNSQQHVFSLDGEGRERHAGDWHSLEVVSLEDGSAVRSVNYDTLRLPAGFMRGWICEIVAFADAGLFVHAALSHTGESFGYYVAELDDSLMLKPLFQLPAVFM